MKRVNRKIASLVLAFGMAASVFAPCAMAEETDSAALAAAASEAAVEVTAEAEQTVELTDPALTTEPAPEVTEEEMSVPLEVEQECPADTPAPEGETADDALAEDTAAQAMDEVEAETVAAPITLTGPATHTEAEVVAAYKAGFANIFKESTYKTQPDLSGAYQTAGEVSDEDLADALKVVNLFRYVAGVQNVTMDSEYNKKAQAACTLMSASGQFSHYLKQPAGCPADFFALADAGARKSNIAAAYVNIPSSILNAYMNDGNADNISLAGHRRSILGVTMGKIGFGVAGTYRDAYSATYTADRSNTTAAKPGYVAWPAAVTPYDMWSGPLTFQYYGGPYEWVESGSATVYSKLENKTYTFDKASCKAGNCVFYTSSGNYGGDSGCVIFGKANNETFAPGDTLTVTVNLTAAKKNYTATYTVQLVDLSKYPGISHLNGRYTLSFDSNGGTPVTDKSTIRVDSQYRCDFTVGSGRDYYWPDPSPTREGYSFSGWYNQKSGGHEVSQYDEADDVRDDVTLYARWASPDGIVEPSEEALGFVDRLYSVCLDRNADPAGRNDWASQLTSYRISGTKAAYGFVFSPEFQGKNYSNEDYVEHLYAAFMGRASDASGKADWVSQLKAGKSREDVFYGFANSVEFDKICNSYGIVSKDIETFVTRLYSVCLGRRPDAAGLADWSNKLRSKESTGTRAAYGFINSSEFMSKKYSNEDYVEHLYAAFMGRPSDAEGKANWVGALKSGKLQRPAVFNGFARSQEFGDICASYGINRG